MALFKKKRKKKKANWKLRLGIPLFLLVFLIWYGMQPIQGTQDYALCRTFVELQLKYPQTLKVLSSRKFQSEGRVYYVYIGPFGERKIEMMGCKFGTDPETGQKILEEATLNRKPMPEKAIEGFNQGLPYINQMELDKRAPRQWDGTYMGLKDE